MRGSSQKHKLVRRPSATSKDTPSQADKEERLLQLKSKIEKEREAMKKTGKRFGKSQSSITSEKKISVQVGNDEGEDTFDRTILTKPFFKKENKVAEINAKQMVPAKEESLMRTAKQSVIQVQPQKTNIKLTQLIPSASQNNIALSSSRLFQKQVDQQKNRNLEVQKFLNGIGLGNYAEGLINMGYDQLEVLMEVKAEELNFLMMRAAQQRKLMEALKQMRQKSGAPEQQQEKGEPLVGLPAFFKARAGVKPSKKQKPLQPQPRSNSFLLSRPKSALTQTSTIPTNNSQLFSNPSFFCSIGSNDWSMDSLIRRACSTCFKVFPSSQLQQKEECYYCKVCSKMEDDVLGLTLSGFLRKDYGLERERKDA